MRATGPDTGKLKPPKQMGKSSSGQGEGKSNSISDGAVRGTDECRIDQIQTHNSEEAVSRGSVGKITSGNENARQPIEICKELSQDRGTYLIGPPLVSDMNTDNRDRWSMVSRMEKESEGAFVATEDVETYSEGHAADMIHNINDQGEGAKDQGNTSKRNVRTWKRVARAPNHPHQLISSQRRRALIAGDHPQPKPKKKSNRHYPMMRDGKKKKKGKEREKELGGQIN
ncbi:hypothetical protein Q3G72_007194 [Acer saccharum]|nr:hypothetical protein Q3G72_007194 [Acer saccharum]